MRILIVTRHYWPSIGGAEVMLKRLGEAWAAAGHAVTVLTTRDDRAGPGAENLAGVRVVRQSIPRARFVGTAVYILKTAFWIRRRRESFDIVYVSMLKHGALAALLAAGERLPVVLRAEGAGATGDSAWQDSARFGRLIRRCCRRADSIVAPAPPIVWELRAAGYPSDRVVLLPNGVPIPSDPWQLEQTSSHRRRLGLPDVPTVVFCGRLHEQKGLGDLVHAIAEIARLGNSVQLVLVGDGPERLPLEQLADLLGIKTRVHFVGAVAQTEPYLRAADVFVLPSYQEGLSVALLEALALGIPTIASDIEPNRNLLPNEQMPLVPIREPTALANLLQTCLEDRNVLGSNISRVREMVREKYGLAGLATRHLELFESLTRARRHHKRADS
jgi:glycosyltransferase involved in cell wall biosynthesis